MGKLHAQRIIDDVADGSTIAGTGETVRKAPILEGIGNGSATGLDIAQNFDRTGKTAAQAHGHSPLKEESVVTAIKGKSKRLKPDEPIAAPGIAANQPMIS
jgi:hypothetical protein